ARAEAVVRAHAHPAARGEVAHERDALLVLAAEDPGAAVDLEERRTPARAGTGTVDVELQIATVHPRVGDVAHPLHLGMAAPERHGELTPVDGRGEPRAHRGEDPVAVVLTEALAECLLDDALGAPGRAVAAREPDPRGERDAEPDDARPRVERASPHEHGGHDSLPRDVVDRQLGSQ